MNLAAPRTERTLNVSLGRHIPLHIYQIPRLVLARPQMSLFTTCLPSHRTRKSQHSCELLLNQVLRPPHDVVKLTQIVLCPSVQELQVFLNGCKFSCQSTLPFLLTNTKLSGRHFSQITKHPSSFEVLSQLHQQFKLNPTKKLEVFRPLTVIIIIIFLSDSHTIPAPIHLTLPSSHLLDCLRRHHRWIRFTLSVCEYCMSTWCI